VFLALSARAALLLWLGLCTTLGLLFGWPVIAASFAVGIGPAYSSVRSRNFMIAFPFAFGGAVVGAVAFTDHSVVAAVLISLLEGIVVGHGLCFAAMWFHHRLEVGRSA